MDDRIKIIKKTSIVGIVINICLALFKIIIGLVANAISVLMDGVNNLADAGTSLITMIGATLAGKPADKKHPFGYGRMEYLSSLIIAGLILYTGITFLIESIQGIINPETSEYSLLSLGIMVAAVVVKFLLGQYTQKMGQKVNSDSLVASGKEALLDVVLSVSTIVAAIIYITLGIGLEAYVATAISLLIIKTGIEVLMETVSKIVGEPAELKLVVDIKKTISSMPHVNGAFDLIVNNYGPQTRMASVHIEVDDTLSVNEIDKLSRTIMEKIYEEYGVFITAVGLYSHRTDSEEVMAMEKNVKSIATSVDYIKGVHGFYVDMQEKIMRFDIVVSFDAKDRDEAYIKAQQAVQDEYSEYKLITSMDADYSELV